MQKQDGGRKAFPEFLICSCLLENAFAQAFLAIPLRIGAGAL